LNTLIQRAMFGDHNRTHILKHFLLAEFVHNTFSAILNAADVDYNKCRKLNVEPLVPFTKMGYSRYINVVTLQEVSETCSHLFPGGKE